MTSEFDLFIEKLINEYITSKNKRAEARYSGNNLTQVRRAADNRNISASQKTKQGNKQYVGNPLGTYGIRNNSSEKDIPLIGISKGLGGIIRPDGVNPKQVGASINSKQGDMIVKHRLANGKVRVGSRGKVNYQDNMTRRDHIERRKKLLGH